MRKIIISFALLVVFSLIGIYFLSLPDIKSDIKSEFGLIEGEEKVFTDAFKKYEIFQCQFGILNTEYVFVSHRDYSFRNEDRELWKTTFYHSERPHPFSPNWATTYTGGTTIKNTTFDELVTMVKDDCEQFKKPKGDYRDETINWSYGAYEPEQEKTPEEIIEQERKDRWEAVDNIRLFYTEEMKRDLADKYGEFEHLPPLELYEWYKNGPEEEDRKMLEEMKENPLYRRK